MPARTPARRKKADEPCPEHYPDGIPEDVAGVGCEHGSWSRDAKAATGPAATEKADDTEGDGE